MTLTYQDGFARPSDVPAYVPYPVSYALGTITPHVVGDGVGARGSAMPILSTHLSDIPSTATGWVIASSEVPDTVTDVNTQEAKFRFHLNVSHILPDDPIRNYGQPGTSHLHQFFGNTTTNAFSTFATLRNRANQNAAANRAASTASGGPYNATGYWIPAMMKGGKVVRPGQINGYYAANPASRAQRAQRLPRGLRYVTGCNMDDPLDTIVKAQIATANAACGVTRYQYLGNGFLGWQMWDATIENAFLTSTGQDYSPCIVNADGSDPWVGMGVTAGCWLKAFINGPVGYDGRNLWSPGGYQHTYHPVYDTYLSTECIPEGAYWIPELQIVPFYQHQGWADYSQWRLSSDDHAAMVAGISPTAWASGRSMHTDWFGAWDDGVFGNSTGWQHDCVSMLDGVTMHTCASGVIRADGTRLLGSIAGDNAPDGSRSPQVNLPSYYNNSSTKDLVVVPSFTGNVTVPARTSATASISVIDQLGDSITAWAGGYAPQYVTANSGIIFHNRAVGGTGLTGTNSPTSQKAAILAAAPQVVSLLIGANDLISYPSGDAYFAAVRSNLTDDLRTAGIKVVLCTILPQSGATDHNTKRAQFNAAIKAAAGVTIDVVCDWDASPMGADSDAADTAKYRDGVHPTDFNDIPSGNEGHAQLYKNYKGAMDAAKGLTPAVSPFTFTDIGGRTASSVVTSNAVMIQGLPYGSYVPYTVSGGQVRKTPFGGSVGLWSTGTSASGVAAVGDQIEVRGTANTSSGGTTNVTLTVGSVSDTFTITTA